MKISMKGDYGVRALVALADHYGNGPVQSREIAERQDIPEPYLDQLLTVLRKAGFIRSRRGPQGGHALARPPTDISMGDVITSLEGSIAAVGCLDGTVDCSLSGNCGQQDIWQEVTAASQRGLDKTSIGDLLDRQHAKRARSTYYI